METITIIIVALVAEAVWETLKMTWQEGKVSIDRIGAIVVSILITIGASIDLFVVVGVPLGIPILGTLLTGLLISRGANFIHELYEKISK